MTLSKRPKVSVCMPVYNGEAFIEYAIRSVLEQSFRDFKLVVCDNCSTDNTQAIVNSFDDTRIVYSQNKENLGIVGNANRCIELADGDYVHILHHDDTMRPDNLERKVRILDENPSVGFVHSNVGFIDQHGNRLNLTKFDADRDDIEKGIVFFEKYILKMPIGASVFIGAVMARLDCYHNLEGFDLDLPNVHDSEMWMRMLLFNDVACISQRLVDYRLHGTMTSMAINDEDGLNNPGLQEHFLACRKVFEKCPDQIPDRERLEKRVAAAFAMRSMAKGIRLLRRGRGRQGLSYLKTAMEFDAAQTMRKAPWALMTALARRIEKEKYC